MSYWNYGNQLGHEGKDWATALSLLQEKVGKENLWDYYKPFEQGWRVAKCGNDAVPLTRYKDFNSGLRW